MKMSLKKKIAAFLVTALVAGTSSLSLVETASAAVPAQASVQATTMQPAVTQLTEGQVQVYNFGQNKVHAYVTGDVLADSCYAIETPEGIVLIESTAFKSKNSTWQTYLQTLNKPIAGELMSYHPNGGDAYGEEAPYATDNAFANWGEGGEIRGLTDKFLVAFGDSVEGSHPDKVQKIKFGDTVKLAGLDFVIRNEGDAAYGIEIPELNVVYIHMMGSDVHNILTSVEHIDAFKAELSSFDYDLVLTSHYAPEGREAVKEKIDYLSKARELATTCKDAAGFIQAMKEAFPNYSGENYLEMSAGILFPGK